MTEDELRAYATTLIRAHAQDIEYLTIHEMAEGYFEDGEISDADADRVEELIYEAEVTVTWPEGGA